MTHEQFTTLVANIRADGHLTSVPLVWRVPTPAPEDTPDGWEGHLVVLSGNHRVRAAIEAGLTEIGWLQVDDPLPEQRALALQLSHNAITGQDDPATLRRLYERLEEVDWRHYSGLDDKALDLLDKVDVSSLAEANLDFGTVQLVFLPPELEQARAALVEARKAVTADERWLLAESQFHPTLEALALVHASYGLANVATAFSVFLAVFNRHLTDLADGWFDPESDTVIRQQGAAPFETLFGRSNMPADAAGVVRQALDRMVGRGDIPHDQRWRALEIMAAEYLAGP